MIDKMKKFTCVQGLQFSYSGYVVYGKLYIEFNME